MAKTTQTTADGWVQISVGAAQIQLHSTDNILAIIHAPTIPLNDDYEFSIAGSGIEVSLGNTPCWVKVMRAGSLSFGYQDIS